MSCSTVTGTFTAKGKAKRFTKAIKRGVKALRQEGGGFCFGRGGCQDGFSCGFDLNMNTVSIQVTSSPEGSGKGRFEVSVSGSGECKCVQGG